MPKSETITFALEIGCEELPPGDLPLAEEQLPRLASEMLEEIRLSAKKISVWTTPRRIILIIEGLPEAQKPLEQEVVGPPMRSAYTDDGKPTKAGLGFAKSQSVELSACYSKKTEKGEYLACKRIVPAKTAAQALGEALPGYIARLSFPRTMRWNQSGVLFPRPIRWLLALGNDKAVAVEFAGLKPNRYTYGHRALAKGKRVSIPHANQLLTLLQANGIIVKREKRVDMMRKQAEKLLKRMDGVIDNYDWLYDEVANTLERPVAVLGAFDQRHLLLPREVIVSALVGYLRFFPIVSGEGKLLPHFIAYHNGREAASPTILRGYQQEITARLNDASFFYQEDIKRGIDAIAGDLQNILFIEGLGTVAEKSERMADLARQLNDILGLQLSDKSIGDAVRLAKADLASLMVQEKEFTSLQGVIGRYYAEHAGYPPEVALAIAEHYLPRVSGGELPASPLGRLAAVCDRLDTLAGCFARGIVPSGSVDPFGLRRQALGLLAILLDCRDASSLLPGADPWHINISTVMKLALSILGEKLPEGVELEQTAQTLLAFVAQRLRGILAEHGIRHDLAEAAVGETLDDPSEVCKRAIGLQAIVEENYFIDMVIVFKRAMNIVKNAKDLNYRWINKYDINIFDKWENNLYNNYLNIKNKVKNNIQSSDYANSFRALAELREPLNEYFDNVMVLDQTPIKDNNGNPIPIKDDTYFTSNEDNVLLYWCNRIPFMEEISQFFLSLADFTKIIVEGE